MLAGPADVLPACAGYGPEGTTIVESGIIRDTIDTDAAGVRSAEDEARRAAADQAMREAQARFAAVRRHAIAALTSAIVRGRHAAQHSRMFAKAVTVAGEVRLRLSGSDTFATVLARSRAKPTVHNVTKRRVRGGKAKANRVRVSKRASSA